MCLPSPPIAFLGSGADEADCTPVEGLDKVGYLGLAWWETWYFGGQPLSGWPLGPFPSLASLSVEGVPEAEFSNEGVILHAL